VIDDGSNHLQRPVYSSLYMGICTFETMYSSTKSSASYDDTLQLCSCSNLSLVMISMDRGGCERQSILMLPITDDRPYDDLF